MYLRRLELRGFKTFALYTDFSFDAGITAIVGPNGSGKSNVADAIRWALGEQSYSVLRGKRTEDMIFAGTSKRPRVGMAEAVLTFDNETGWLPIDFREVTITRRAFRSGENQYLINGSRVLLRDVTDLLGKAGLGRRGFVVIGQGLIDSALSLRPEERRTLLEEAAGVHVYQDKRRDALAKLAETQQNVLRVKDILHEITPRMRELERQARRAGERDVLLQDLEKLMRISYTLQWRRVQEQIARAEAELQKRHEATQRARTLLQEAEQAVATMQATQSQLRRQVSQWHKESGDLHGEAEVTGRQFAAGRERLRLLGQRAKEVTAEMAQLQERRAALEAELATGEQELARLQADAQARSAAIADVRAALPRAESARNQAEDAMERARDKAFAAATAIADLRNRLQQLAERQKQLVAEREEQRNEMARLEQDRAAREQELAQIRERHAQLQQEAQAAAQQRRALQDKQPGLEQVIEEKRGALNDAMRQRQRLEDRYEMLQGMRENMAGFAPGARAVLQARGLSGIVGPVARLLQVPQRIERAIDAALGGQAQAIVVDTWDAAKAAIERLRNERAGRATFLPLDSLRVGGRQQAPQGQGVLGLASDLVQYDKRYDKAVQLLLGSVLVVEDLDTAHRVLPRLPGSLRLVTLAGDIVRSSGMMTGGASQHEGQGGLLSQEREWRELPARVAAAQEQEQRARDEVQQAREAQEANRREIAAIGEEHQRITREATQAERLAAQLEQKQERVRQEVGWRQTLAQQQERELRAADAKSAEIQAQIDEHVARQARLAEELEAARQRLEAATQAENAARQAVHEAQASVAGIERQVSVQRQLVETQRANRDRVAREWAEREQRMRALAAESAELAGQVQSLQAQADGLAQRIAALTTQLDPAEGQLLSMESQLVELEREVARRRQRLVEEEGRLSQQMLDRERQQDALASLQSRIDEELGEIEYSTERVQQLRMEFAGQTQQVAEMPDVDPEELQSEIRQLRARLRRLGDVNPNAPLEYHQVSERHDFLQAQVQDLEQSAAGLQHVIRELDEVMKRDFLTVFNQAAEAFPRYFQTLFGGGKARLELTDPDDLATTGVEITAQPPGKRPQSLALLSGGERALTATALLFAVLKAKPIPFCFLDEVDAMLDEANVGRFRDLLREFATQTQFIVITHNRHTMEAAHTIYGVSQEQEGVSTIISLQLDDVKTQEA